MCFFLPQVRGHSTALSVGPPSPRRETCFATSNFIPGRSLSNVPCAATPADDVTPWAGTCAPILVPASHTLTCEADTVCTCVQYHAGWFLTPSCWFLTPFKSEHMLSLHGSYSNTPPCTLTRLHNSHMTSYSLTPGNVLTHFQFTCFTCRHAARPLICTSSVLFETT